MQPFDALTIKVVLQEASPLLLNRKVDRVQQLARDEIVITLRSHSSMSHLLLSAHASLGRLCLVNMAPSSRQVTPPAFCMLLRKYLTGATLVGVEQLPGERIVDIIFSCLDEVGTPSHKVLTAEMMGRHSNLIFWDKATSQVLCASHMVTRDMSRQREVMPGLQYVRPPAQDKPNIFTVSQQQFSEMVDGYLLQESGGQPLEQWLMASFTGLGRHLSEEIAASVEASPVTDLRETLWSRISSLQGEVATGPAVKLDLTRYTTVSWWTDVNDPSQWKTFPSANDMVENYFRSLESRERFQQLKDRLAAELKQEIDRHGSRLAAAAKYLSSSEEKSLLKKSGDLVLAHIADIQPGQSELVCEDLYTAGGSNISIQLNPNISASQNAQNFYRMFAKSRAREAAAGSAASEARAKLEKAQAFMSSVESATTIEELDRLKGQVSPARLPMEPSRPQQAEKKRAKQHLLKVNSSDGWTIYVGRNRQENDELITHVAQPHDIWMHILGSGGAHVLIKVPSTKQMPPARTLQEAAQAAARLSKASAGSKVQVVYTQCRYVRKVAKNKPGVVRYENEKTLDVDTAEPMPQPLKQLFATKK